MCLGCLPTRVRLQDKGVSCPADCASCGAEQEDLNHLLFECSFAIQDWNSAGIYKKFLFKENDNDSNEEDEDSKEEDEDDEHVYLISGVFLFIFNKNIFLKIKLCIFYKKKMRKRIYMCFYER